MNLIRLLIFTVFVQSSVVWSQDETPRERLELNELYEKAPHYGDWAAALKSLPPAQKTRYVKFLREEMKRNPISYDSYLKDLMFLGDTAARDELVQNYYRDGAVGRGFNKFHAFRAAGDPELITMLAPALLLPEPFQRFGTDAFSYPLSFDAASTIVAVAGNSPAFNSDVINWARSFDAGETPPDEQLRGIVREWWHANEQFFRDKIFAAVRPGRLPALPPAAEERVPADTALEPKPSLPHTNPQIAEMPQESSNNRLAYLITGAVATLLALAYWLNTRRVRAERGQL